MPARLKRPKKVSSGKPPTKKTVKAKTPATTSESSFFPREANVPSSDFLNYFSLFYGTKGIGKTTVCSQLDEDSIVFMLEPARRNLKIRMVEFRPRSTREVAEDNHEDCWKRIVEMLDKASDDDSVKHVTLDTIDIAYATSMTSTCVREGIEHPGGLNDYGAAWNAVKTDFESVLNNIKYEGKLALTFTSHATEKDIELSTGKTKKNFAPTASGSLMKYIKEICDYAFFYGYHEKQRALHVRMGPEVWTACGNNDTFCCDEGKISILEMPEDESKSGKAVLAAFNNSPITDVIELWSTQEEE